MTAVVWSTTAICMLLTDLHWAQGSWQMHAFIQGMYGSICLLLSGITNKCATPGLTRSLILQYDHVFDLTILQDRQICTTLSVVICVTMYISIPQVRENRGSWRLWKLATGNIIYQQYRPGAMEAANRREAAAKFQVSEHDQLQEYELRGYLQLV